MLDLAVEAERTGTARAAPAQRHAARRGARVPGRRVHRGPSRSRPKEVFDFLASIGGERYSRDVLIKVAESYVGQAEYERATTPTGSSSSWSPTSIKAAEYQREIVAELDERARRRAGAGRDQDPARRTTARTRRGRRQQKNREALAPLARDHRGARARHRDEHPRRGAAPREGRARLPKQTGCATQPTAAETYDATTSSAFERTSDRASKAQPSSAIELRFYRADILFFKLGKIEEAGDEYLAVGKTAPVGKYHKDALLNAMAAYEKARPKDTVGRRKLSPVDKKFGEAIDLYATLFPADPTLVGVIFKNGQLFYDYGDYDEAIKRFGLIVTKYPNDPNAGPAGDRILDGAQQGAGLREHRELGAQAARARRRSQSKDQQDAPRRG